MKAVVAAFNSEKALVGAFSVIVQPVVEPMEQYTALVWARAPTITITSTAIAHGILIGAGVGAAAPLDNQDQYWPQVHPGSTTTAAAESRYYNEFLPLLPIPINSPVAGSSQQRQDTITAHMTSLCSVVSIKRSLGNMR